MENSAKMPKIAIFRPSEYSTFYIPHVHIRTYIFKKLNRYVNQLFSFICVENPVCFLVCYVCIFDVKIIIYNCGKSQILHTTKIHF